MAALREMGLFEEQLARSCAASLAQHRASSAYHVVLSRPQADDMVDIVALLSRWHLTTTKSW